MDYNYYLVSNTNEIAKFPKSIKIITVKESINLLLDNIISYDSETTGLNFNTDELLLMQLGARNNLIIVDCLTIDIIEYKNILENNLLILQNGKFDIKFLYKKGIIVNKVYDTMIAEQILYPSIDPFTGKSYIPKANYKILVEKYCDEEISKDERVDFNEKNYLSPNKLYYAYTDIKYLSIIRDKQLIRIKELELQNTLKIENNFVRILAYIEFCGIKLDKDKWIAKVEETKIKLEESKRQLDNYIIKNYPELVGKQYNIFNDIDIDVNWSSSKQVIQIFNKIGIDTKADNITGNSVENSILTPQKDKFEIINLYLKYQEYSKDYSTYGYAFLDNIDESTGRIHPSFKQIQITSRVSSNSPNLQNLPHDKRTRECFIAEDGNNLIDSDYTAQEDIIFTNFSKESKMIEFYKSKEADGHAYVAKLCFPKQLKDLTLQEIKQQYPDLRFIAKSAKFAIHYAGSPKTISENLSIDLDRAKEIYNSYMKAFPNIANYLKYRKKLAMKNGYILINSFSKRKIWCRYFKDIIKSNNLRALEKFAKLSANYPIQGTGAEMIKVASIYLFDWVVKNNFFNIILFPNIIHDELLIECPKKLTEITKEQVKYCMEKPNKFYCKIIPVKAVPEVSDYWEH